MPKNPERKLFILRLDHRLNRSLTQGIVGLGWWRAAGLQHIHNWADFKKLIRDSYPVDYQNEYSLGNAAGSVWRFLKSMNVGDSAIVPVPGAFHVARVESPAFYDPEGANDEIDYAYRRRVTWETNVDKPVLRTHASGTLQRWMKARQTCVEVESGLERDLEDALRRKAPTDFSQAVLEAAQENVARVLREAITDQGLENVVKRLAQASGARCWIPPKNSGLPGDADIMAQYDLGIAGTDTTVEVAYQVKQHTGQTDDWGVQQLIDRMAATPSIVRGCLVTTADDVSETAKHAAEEHAIVILTKRQLVQWVLSVGLGALSASES